MSLVGFRVSGGMHEGREGGSSVTAETMKGWQPETMKGW
jgi:hypothetical protein